MFQDYQLSTKAKWSIFAVSTKNYHNLTETSAKVITKNIKSDDFGGNKASHND